MRIDQENVNITAEIREVSSFVSRSVTLIIMHLMYIHKMKLKHIYDSIQAIR